MRHPPRLIRVAVPVPGLDPLTYLVPDDMATPQLGSRVLVPLGGRTVTGCMIGGERADAGGEGDQSRSALKPIVAALDGGAFLPEAVVKLALWTAEYYAAGPGETLSAAWPPHSAVGSELRARVTELGRQSIDSGDIGDKERAVLAELAGAGELAMRAIASRLRKRTATTGGESAFRRTSGRLTRARTDVETGSRAHQVRALVRSLAARGLVEMIQPMRGRASGFKSVRRASLAPAAHETAALARARLGPSQRDALSLLQAAPDGLLASELRERKVSIDTLGRLTKRGLVVWGRERVDRDPFSTAALRIDAGDAAPAERVLTHEQLVAIEPLTMWVRARAFRVALLHGVTGSGKTEIYMRLAEASRVDGRGVLVLVPEIALTPALAASFRQRLGDRVAIQHSGLGAGERHDQWHRIRRGEVDVVIGTRSAVFAPLPSIGLIVVDEEHDASYKQDESPRYHARDVAIVRARQEGALVVLGSATPSLETFQHARTGRYERLVLDRRVLDRPLATVRLVDMREQFAAHGPDVVLSDPLRAAIDERLNRREQALVLLNRRGLATAVFCRECAATLECPNCSVPLTIHGPRQTPQDSPTKGGPLRRARCHYCGHAALLPKVCVQCAGPYLDYIGFGTERVERELREAFPQARVARLDRDTVRRRGAVAALLERFGRGEIDVLVGTQMIAKGHDFPDVTLVGVISADVGLGLADFRAAERTFQLLTQVAGRAGRGERPGEAIIQTLYPNHYSIRHACNQNYTAFFDEEMRFRRAMRYPPHVALINVIVRAPTFAATMNAASELVERVRVQSGGADGFRVLGPAPAPLGRLKGEFRAQFFLKGTHRPRMRAALQATLAEYPALRRRVTIDVDPLSVL